MATAKFLLEHFYYGKLVHHGKPTGEDRLLAGSSGIDSELASLAVQRVPVPAPENVDKGAWAVVRGRDKKLPFVMVQVQKGDAGQVTAHYIIAAPDVLRAISGNLRVLAPLIEDKLPTYELLGDTLEHIEIDQPEPISVDDQVEDILEMMMITKNKIPVIESLLSAIVQGVQLVVINGPDQLQARLDFIAGLLALLPRSARFGVTYTTYSHADTDLNAQIRFIKSDNPPGGTLIYDWKTGKVSGITVEDDYSKFVISQLRLDAELVIQRTSAMTHIAAWRINRGDRLADSLAYASKRLRLDESLRTNQPVNTDEIAEILTEDTTLDEEMRLRYAEHLIRFALAMRDMSKADPVALIVRDLPTLEKSVLSQMRTALNEGELDLVYDALIRWLSNPLGPQSRAWIDLLEESGLTILREIVEDQDTEGAIDFLEEMQTMGVSLPLGEMIPQVIRITAPLSAQDTAITRKLFLLSVRYLDDKTLTSLLNDTGYRNRLPQNIRDVWTEINQDNTATPMPETLITVHGQYGVDVLIRFVELAINNGRVALINAKVIQLLRDLAFTDEGIRYKKRLLHITQSIETTGLKHLEAPAPTHLLQIRLALKDYDSLGRQMLNQSGDLYPGDLQIEYLKAVERLFVETPITPTDIPMILDAIAESGVRSAPYATAAIGALNKQESTPQLNSIAADCVNTLADNQRWLEVIPPTTVLTLLGYYARNKDVENTIRAAGLVPLSAAHNERGNVRVMSAMYKRMTWHENTQLAALQMLRTFVREADDENARRAVGFFGRELGSDVRDILESSYILRRYMAEMDIETYAQNIRQTANILEATAAAFINSRKAPGTGDIIAAFEDMYGSLLRDVYGTLARASLNLGRTIVFLGNSYQHNSRHTNALLTSATDPQNALDVMWVMSGYFARGKPITYTVDEAREPFGTQTYSKEEFKQALMTTEKILHSALRTLPPKKKMKLNREQIRSEVESMWANVSELVQENIVGGLAADLQRIPILVHMIYENGDAQAVDPNSNTGKRIDTGRQKPKSTLEMYRFLYSYFKGRS